MALLASLNRGRPAARRSLGAFFQRTPELLPLAAAVSFGCIYGIYKMVDKTTTDPHLRKRGVEGLPDPNAWKARVRVE
ncbi:hypothetical protein AMAG_03240 [Allomyces macrogynus ATCC 38327]|uniref:NADH dehydrogenase [ubiquinone] 1 alpha subcomplex subunit 4 n=1 Tax=Allomyces macrogynus (strain ATCC 38327) TaxID=578462 RepID=A0A0L0S507_ALLM3|nr:hypothetical protein AMAG_03240 [Allomyces macrogynus ATCC 38327]|eukprot:KNE57540.1 hypothetical protein AMAG_03240 [Allomyces macrogynus ATCC 38327]